MSRSWWKKLFGRKDSSARPVTKAKLNLHGTRLEDRLAPATLTDSGSTLTITLDNANEQVGIVSNGTTYDFTSTNNFVDGGVDDTADFSAFGATNLTMNASGLARYSDISIVDAASGTSVSFNDSGANAYSDRFSINLNNGSNALLFSGASNFGASDFVTFVSGTITVNAGAAVSATGGKTITFQADGQVIDGAVSATGAGGRIFLAPGTVGVGANLGSAAAGFNFSQAELDNLTTPLLEIFPANGVNLVSPVTLDSAKVPTLYLNSSFVGGITDSTGGEQTDLTVDNLRINSVAGIGVGDAIDISVKTLSFNNTAGAVQISNAGALTIASVAGSTNSNNSGTTTTITASSPLTIATDIISAGDITLIAGEISDGPAFADDLTVNAGIKVQSTGGDVTLQAGDDIILNDLSLVQADTAGKLITLTAGFNDLDGAGAIAAVGTPSVVATNLGMTAIDGVGSLANPIVTTVSNVEAFTTTGDMFITNTGDVTIGGLSGTIAGLSAGGNIAFINDGSITFADTTGFYNVSGVDVTVTANGANSDIVATTTSDLISSLGSMSVTAGRDIKLGTVLGADNDFDAFGALTINVGRNLITDGDADLRADSGGGSAGMSITAGRDVIIGSATSTAELNDFGTGNIVITTGTGATFALDAGVVFSPITVAGSLEVNADRIILGTNGNILATGGVTLRPFTAGRAIDLGSTTDVGATLEISSAELDKISTGTLVIGGTTAGDITLSDAIAPLFVTTLELITGGAIVDGNAVGVDITISDLAVRSVTGIQLDTTVNTLAVRNTTSGNVEVLNVGAVTLGFVGSLDGTAGNELGNFAAGGTSTFAASSPFTYAVNFTSGGTITTTTADNGATHIDNITVLAGVTVQSTGGDIKFWAGDDVVIAATATVQSDVGDVSLHSGESDTDGSGVITIDGTISAGTAVTLRVQVDNAVELPGVSAVTEGAGGSIVAPGLLLINLSGSGRLFDLSASSTNAVGTIAAGSNAAIDFRNSGALTVGIVTSTADGTTFFGIGTSSRDVTLRTEDLLTLNEIISAGVATVTLTSDTNAIATTVNGVIFATSLALVAETGIGALIAPLVTSVSNLEAVTTTGGIFIDNGKALNIGGVSAAIVGVQATTSGDIRIINSDSIILDGTPTDDIRTASGNVFVQATGATSDIEVRNDSADAIDSGNGNVTLDAGRDILLGSATTDNFGDVEANGDVTLLAGRDIIIDEDTDVEAFGVGTIVATAGGNISLLSSDGTIGSSLATAGGTITITTGPSGTFTHTAGATGSVKTINAGGNGEITINADNIEIASPIDAGTECVILQAVSAGTQFDLGGADGAGTIGLTDAELDFIFAGVLQIGNATAGPISVTGAISLSAANVPTLDLRTGASVTDAGGTLNVANLVFETGSSLVLTGINTIGTVAGTAVGTIQLWSAGKLEIGAVVNCDGVTINGIDSNNGNIQLVVDDLEISQQLNAGTADLVIAPFTGGTINLGTEVVGSLSLTGLETAQIISGRLEIGAMLSGAITVDAAVGFAMQTHLQTGGSITGAGSITTTELSLTSGDSVSLTGANDVDTLAGFSTGSFEFTDADDLDVGTVAGISVTEIGVTSLASDVRLNAGALLNLTEDVNAAGNATLNTTSVGVTQTTGDVLAAGLELLGTGTFTLTSATNDVTTLAGNVTGAVSYRDANAITIGTVNSVGLGTGGNALTLQADGIDQSAALGASVLSITGNGNVFLGHAGNDVASFTSNTTGGQVIFRDANDLTIAAGGITTGGNPLSILTGRSFTLNSGTAINLGAASGGVTAGMNDASKADKSTTVTLNGTVTAHPATGFRLDGGIGSNTFIVTPSTSTPIFIFGSSPVVAELSPAIRGDALSLQTSALGAEIGLNGFDPVNGNGAFTFTDPNNSAVEKARPVIFNSIENIKGLSMEAAAVQVSENNYQLIAAGALNGQPFRGGFSGTLPPVAPFLISPQFVSPVGPFTAPRVSVGDIDADGLPDLIVGFGRNSGSPLVTVVKGTRIFDSSKAGQPLQASDIMTQFYAYNPSYQGGVFVSAADLNGDGRAEIITGAGESGGPHVKIFSIDASKAANANVTVVGEFFAYDPNFVGGVRVAAGDVNGDGQIDIVTAAGIGGGPHVKVFSGAGTTSGPGAPSLIGQYFAYAANFLGGVFVDVGDYDRDGFADILTGAGFGGGPHIRVFDGETLSKSGGVAVLNEFFDDPPSGSNPSPIQDDASALSAGVTGVGFGNFEDTDTDLDIFVGSGIGRRTRVRIYKNGSHEPVRDGSGRPVDFLSGGTNYQFDNRRDGANVAVGGAFVS